MPPRINCPCQCTIPVPYRHQCDPKCPRVYVHCLALASALVGMKSPRMCLGHIHPPTCCALLKSRFSGTAVVRQVSRLFGVSDALRYPKAPQGFKSSGSFADAYGIHLPTVKEGFCLTRTDLPTDVPDQQWQWEKIVPTVGLIITPYLNDKQPAYRPGVCRDLFIIPTFRRIS